MSAVLLERPAQHVALVRINRPQARNALNAEVRAGINTVFPQLDADSEVRCIVLAGSDTVFAAGADLKERATMDVVDAVKFIPSQGIRNCRKPVIAAVNGYALGGGCEYAMQCDIILANDKARFGQPEIKVGLVPGAGGTQRLPRAIGKFNAMWMLLTGNFVSAADALRMGLVCEVIEGNCEPRAIELAKQIAELPPLAAMQIKEVVQAGADMSLDSALKLETKSIQLLHGTRDMREGVNAFIEKRKPSFEGR
ncbi:MAG: enoyl-CoA hydratase [Betaproteobacteria bacterium RIFCSPLOWO2_02_FULL_64_12]|nr:MAG: enoyl-CoA hydratase [Betaproteobacteria bacterium RIFCSPLOWO2_02_FULL_64_12]